jgi:tetratricopeptide (TPR) repeat protein
MRRGWGWGEDVDLHPLIVSPKKRSEIPSEIAARILFLSDRRCCVCRVSDKPVQIHHIDDDASNHDPLNLAVLCFDCHRNTQITGGFDRKLDSDQILLYKDDWQRLVSQNRAREERHAPRNDVDFDLELVTSVAEIYRENEAFEKLAIHYDALGNDDLRDKYIELALQKDSEDETVVFLRTMQGKPELIPQEVVDRSYAALTGEELWLARARLLLDVKRFPEAAADFLRGIGDQLRDRRYFTAAFYLKELATSPIIRELFVIALKKAQDDGDVWWQVRAYQELGWHTELDELLKARRTEIEASDDLSLKEVLQARLGSREDYIAVRKEIARSESSREA